MINTDILMKNNVYIDLRHNNKEFCNTYIIISFVISSIKFQEELFKLIKYDDTFQHYV